MGINIPLTVEESDGSPSITGVRKIKYTGTVTNDGDGVVTLTDGTGSLSGTIATGQVAYATATDTIGGSDLMTFDAAGAPKFKLIGTTPRLYLGDTDVSSAENEMLLLMKSGAYSYIYDRQDAGALRLGAGDNSSLVSIDADGGLRFLTMSGYEWFDWSPLDPQDSPEGGFASFRGNTYVKINATRDSDITTNFQVYGTDSNESMYYSNSTGYLTINVNTDGYGIKITDNQGQIGYYGGTKLVLNEDDANPFAVVSLTAADYSGYVGTTSSDDFTIRAHNADRIKVTSNTVSVNDQRNSNKEFKIFDNTTTPVLHQNDRNIDINGKLQVYGNDNFAFAKRGTKLLTSNYTVSALESDGDLSGMVFVNTTSSAIDLTIPNAALMVGSNFKIITTDSAGTITVKTSGDATLNGVTAGSSIRSIAYDVNHVICYSGSGTALNWVVGNA